MIKNILFPLQKEHSSLSLALLLLRVVLGLLLAMHGWQKLMAFDALSTTFPDPLGVGSQFSLILAIFGELICAVAFIVGFLFRLSTLPMIVTMCVAFFAAHGGKIAEGELAFVYLAMLVIAYITGPGKYSIDAQIAKRLKR